MRLDNRSQGRVAERLQDIVHDPYGPATKPLQNAAGRRAARVGGLRIVFEVNQAEQTVDVADIAPRGQVYRRL